MNDRTTAPAAPLHWDALRGALPEPYRAIPLADLPLPTRLHNHAARAKITTLGDLARRSESELLLTTGLGRRSVDLMSTAMCDVLHCCGFDLAALAARLPDPAAAREAEEQAERWFEAQRRARPEACRRLTAAGFLASWTEQLQALAPMRRRVLTLRAGLDGRPETFSMIGATIGRSRERVRRIEIAALLALGRQHDWLDAIRARPDEALREGAAPLATLAADPWWAGIVALPEALDYLGERLLGDELRVVDIFDQPHLTRGSKKPRGGARRPFPCRGPTCP